MGSKLKTYLRDPLLNQMFSEVRKAGPLKSILVDITHLCNLRCQGCYFFAEDLDAYKAPSDEGVLDTFIEQEKARGTNYVTVVGGEPSLQLDRLKKLYDNFWLVVVTNGLRKIPYDGFENMPIGISVWGDHETDTHLRGYGKIDVFDRSLKNFKDDPRAIWYYTTTPGNAHEIESVVDQCVANGNYVTFNFYGDVSSLGEKFDHTRGFEKVRREIDRAIQRHPDKILMSPYIAEVVSTGELFGQKWGYDVCPSVTFDNEINRERIKNGHPYNTHFRAYNPDLKTTRRCSVGNERDCSTCYDVYVHFAWIMLHMKRHLHTEKDFTNWLTTVYLFYLGNRIVDFEAGIKLLPSIHERLKTLRDEDSAFPSFNTHMIASGQTFNASHNISGYV